MKIQIQCWFFSYLYVYGNRRWHNGPWYDLGLFANHTCLSNDKLFRRLLTLALAQNMIQWGVLINTEMKNSVSINCVDSLEYLSDSFFAKNDPVPWSSLIILPLYYNFWL